jgi:hypothetical protein
MVRSLMVVTIYVRVLARSLFDEPNHVRVVSPNILVTAKLELQAKGKPFLQTISKLAGVCYSGL